MTQEALKLALEALENIVDAIYINSQQEADAVCKANEAITAIKEALAKEKTLQALHSENKRLGLYKDAYAQPEQDIAELVTGMEVSIDVSTGDHDSGNRLYGVVDLVQQSQGSKHGLILLVQETKANFKEALAQPEQPKVRTGDCLLVGVCASEGHKISPQRTEQEPVGRFAKFTDGIWGQVTDYSAGIPLYTTPPQRTWVGLTLDEIALLHANYPNPQGFALALQAKLKEKNT